MERYWLIRNDATGQLLRYWPHETEGKIDAALVGFSTVHVYLADGPLPKKYWALRRHLLRGE